MASEDKITLFTFFRSSASYRVRIALNWKGIDHESIYINLAKGEQHNEEYKSINPSHMVPVLKLADGKSLTQSEAIIEYLDETYPDRPLLPHGPVHRAQVRAIAQFIACDIHPIQNLSVLKHVGGDDMDKRVEWANHWIDRGFQALEKTLAGSAGIYCVGDNITLADIFLVPMVYNAKRFKVDMQKFPIINRINNTLLTLSEFSSASPENQPDCPPEMRQ
ncbi:Maleylacetoacetate isomerase [Hesseltinella vesiculosa]|uniref:Maleylacetoacetate isomerase n=1 Tax=Hesseltinella vesiculosa TaxID=101127 RepID=A0A1X2GRP6_9FUNG|nr:Maleylacetoacetate isomerase [Hesseltinella vesiculosa]